MSMIDNIQTFADQKSLPLSEALQIFLQVVVLKNLSWKSEKMIGGTALVLGHGNPRFSEDIDLTNVQNPMELKPYLEKAAREAGDWLQEMVKLKTPKPKGSTWKLSANLPGTTERVRLHIDSQRYPALSHHSLVIVFPGLKPFLIASVSLEEIMADKLIALALRNYVSGRDLFDLWCHWFKDPFSSEKENEIRIYLQKKLKARTLGTGVLEKITSRLQGAIPSRAEEEWKRYLPPNFQQKTLYREMFLSVHNGIERFLHANDRVD